MASSPGIEREAAVHDAAEPARPSEPPLPTSKATATKDAKDGSAPLWPGLLFFWILGMAVWQDGMSGALTVFLALYALVAVGLLAVSATKAAARYAGPLAAFAFLALWWGWAGSYSAFRDALLGTCVFVAVVLAFPEARLWLRRMPARLRAWMRLHRLQERQSNAPPAKAQRAARRATQVKAIKTKLVAGWRWSRAKMKALPAPPPPPPATPAQAVAPQPLRRRIPPLALAIGGVGVWLTLSLADSVFESRPLPLRGQVLQPAAMPAAYQGLKVGLAMSGGGYRAALVHAGVVDALGQLGVPVTHMSSVSGGSIIAAFISQGGAPQDFRDAVIAGRFRMQRDMLAAHNLVRLPSPGTAPGLGIDVWPFFGEFSRLNVQANLVDRVLLAGSSTADPARPRGPALMVCMTDLTYGFSVGALEGGVLLSGPTTARFFQTSTAIDFPALRLSERVAVSGAFPGAFPTLNVKARITTTPEPLAHTSAAQELNLVLADGGVRDNLGLALLEAADASARKAAAEARPGRWTGFDAPAHWALDLILVSDGGKFVQPESVQGMLSATMRAIDLSGLETGVLRPLRQSWDRPLVMLSALATLAPNPDAIALGQTQSALRDHYHRYFRPATLAHDVLEKIVALHPQPEAARSALQRWQRLPPDFQARLDGIERRCTANTATTADDDCAWWAFVDLVGSDIWSTMQTFARTPTLADTMPIDQAQGVYRFGQYLVLLMAAQIRAALQAALHSHGAT